MIMTSEEIKGLEIVITAGATKSHPADNSSPIITLQQYYDNVNHLDKVQ